MTNPKSVNFIQEEDRIVTFDMDGTFVGELYPTYFEYNMLEYRVLMPETIIECRLERFFISTACISFSDKKGKIGDQSGTETPGIIIGPKRHRERTYILSFGRN